MERQYPKGTWQAEAQANGKRFEGIPTDPSMIDALNERIEAKRAEQDGGEVIVKHTHITEQIGNAAIGQAVDQLS